ncbi:ABC transporter substrate-binding protein [Streptomyces solaniscabiei]|uniref:ABC transporter substrate-binding protein n=1 Tax=Streptomyces solaniscabiei TaxID=2683255 RepID=UPI001CE33151|nr:extracellular solute-binding protein [Streptomyces solaniscabiei]
MINRRAFLGLAGGALAASGLSLAGCGTGTQTSPSGTIRFAWWGNDVRHGLTDKAVDLFLKDNPDIKVSTQPGDWGGYWDKLAVAVAGGDAPDLMQQCDPYIAEYAQRGALADLSKVKGLDLTPFSKQAMSSSTIDGAVYGVPNGMSAPAFWVNPAALKEAGVELPDTDTWSWDDYARVCEEITKKSGGKIKGSAQLTFDEQSFTIFARQRGENLFTDKGIGFTKDTLVEWWEYILDLQSAKVALTVQESVEAVGRSIEESALVTGRVAFSFGWTNQLSQAQTAGKVELQLIQPPGETSSPQRGMYIKASQHYSIAAKSSNTEEAAKLLDFLVNDPAAGAILLTDRGIPANPKVLDSVRGTFQDGDTKAADYITKVENLAQSTLPIPPVGASAIVTAFPRFSQDVLFKRKSPTDAADAFIAEMKSSIK